MNFAIHYPAADYNTPNKKRLLGTAFETKGGKPCVTKEISPLQMYKQIPNQQIKILGKGDRRQFFLHCEE